MAAGRSSRQDDVHNATARRRRLDDERTSLAAIVKVGR
jgi:hypothetical protein